MIVQSKLLYKLNEQSCASSGIAPMSDPDSHPMADWPDELLRQWNKFSLTGAVDSQNPPATARGAHHLLVELQLR